MSRKEPSFGQLAAYMSDEKSDRSFDLHHNLFARDPGDIATEFEANAQRLGRRRGGNYLYHEILSIDTRLCGQSREVREKLRLLALEFIQKRCPRNIVYGALHRDHAEHLHYHLMISANERGDAKRLRLTKAAFDAAKRELELSARTNYPELKQTEILASTPQEKQQRRETREGRNAQEMKKRGARLTKTEALAQELRAILAYANSQAELERLLAQKGFTFYERGKHCGVRPIPGEGETKGRKSYRFATLGIQAEYADFVDRVAPVIEPEMEEDVRAEKGAAGEKEKAPEGAQRQEETRAEPEPASQQDADAKAARDAQEAFRQEMAERRAKQAEKERTQARTQSRGPQGRKR
ncbi:relaxase/mobilization nuclease domain-containing protein [Sulfitobacter sp.]|uniref:relaxase/mobilization nuclease domain-containing protein n=1 Tax=Sulfitobacter sp. TaxID=1903071 RepID=UPI003567EAFE